MTELNMSKFSRSIKQLSLVLMLSGDTDDIEVSLNFSNSGSSNKYTMYTLQIW